MKKYLFILIGLLFIGGVSEVDAAKLKFIKKPMKKVLKKANKKGMPIFVDVYADWCGPCKMMDKEVFSRDDVADFLSENFVTMKMDADNSNYIYEKFEYEITKLPTMLFLNSDGTLIKKYTGTTTGSSLLSMARKALKEAKATAN